MLTPEYLQELPKELTKHYRELEERILREVIKSIDDNMDIRGSARVKLEALLNIGYDQKKIEEIISKETKLGQKKTEKLIEKAGLKNYANDVNAYKFGGKMLMAYKKNNPVKNLVKAVKKDAVRDIGNLTGSIGCAGERLTTFYRDRLNQGAIAIQSGAYSQQEIIRKTINEMAKSGIQVINYSSGRNYNIETAVRMSLMHHVNHMAGNMALLNAEDMEQDLMELTAHAGARPSHAEWQEEIVSLSGRSGYLSLDDIGYGAADGFLGVNCRHGWNPYFEGLSERAWSKKDLKNIDNPPFEYDGKQYDHYQATQRQRNLERSMRIIKRKVIMYDAVGDKEQFTIESVKLQRLRKEYKKFTKASKLKSQVYRSQAAGYNKSISSKQVWANKKAEKEAKKLYKTKDPLASYLKDLPLRKEIKTNPNYKVVREGKQDLHLGNLRNIKMKSQFMNTKEEVEKIIFEHMGKGEIFDKRKTHLKELIEDTRLKGKIYDEATGVIKDTSKGTIHYSKKGVHLVPTLRSFKELKK
ncbi:MAG: polymorphic toxin type 50 domain-containing protein [Tissierellia bacterium]|nr:polymorphic toxin type 50 domain-containing protein [Tissierellia bacterium]